MTKTPKKIIAVYSQTFEFDLEEHGIKHEDIKSYYIKYGTIYIALKDGTEREHAIVGPFDSDYKWPDEAYYVDENYDEI